MAALIRQSLTGITGSSCYILFKIGGIFVHFFRTSLFLLAAMLLPATSASAQIALSTEQQKQAQILFNEHQAMQIAMKSHQKCSGLDTLTFVAAAITADLRKNALVSMQAMNKTQVATARGSIQKEIDAQKCEDIKENSNLIISNDHAMFYKNFYLLVWYEYVEVAALRMIMNKSALTDGKDKFGCGKYSFDQIRAIAPFTDAAREALKGKGQFENSRAQAEQMIKNCQAKAPGIAASPLMQLMDAAQTEMAKKSEGQS